MKTYSTTKKLPIYAAMKFDYKGNTTQNKMSLVGYKWVKFIFDSPSKDCLINEVETKRSFL